MKSARFEFKTLDDARSLASLISNACPEPEKIVMGITELMINAIEHGNLGIGYEEKSSLNQSGLWEDEINRRLSAKDNVHLFAEISYKDLGNQICISIIDQGKGFDWQNYLEFDPERVMDNHGRGIAIANNLSFKRIEYRGKGNEVYAYV
jgi:anti-sigma regulatory factor (Ser/Thr protein kinase)